jgi:hypothetical protein
MNTYKFYVIDDAELYHWDAVTIEQARREICDEFEIEQSDIEAIALDTAL